MVEAIIRKPDGQLSSIVGCTIAPFPVWVLQGFSPDNSGRVLRVSFDAPAPFLNYEDGMRAEQRYIYRESRKKHWNGRPLQHGDPCRQLDERFNKVAESLGLHQMVVDQLDALVWSEWMPT